jgi:hypothetical protein
MMRTFLAASLAIALAGCMSVPVEPAPTTSAPADSYALTAIGFPSTGTVNQNVTFQLEIKGGPMRTSDHIGGHYWNNQTTDPTAEFAQQAGACVHVPGVNSFPATFNVTCRFAAPGTYYVHGHLRYVDGETTRNFWTVVQPITIS